MGHYDSCRDDHVPDAGKMVEPMKQAWKLVPVDPTTEMVGAATRVDFDNEDEVAMTINLWHAMVAAAPPHIAADAPEFSGLALQKLEGLIERGWQVNGYSIQKDDEIGLVTAGGFVGWFTTASKNADAAEARIKALEVRLDSKTTVFRDMVALGASADEIMRFRDGYPNPAGGSKILYRHTIEQARYRYADAIIAARSTATKEKAQ